MPGPDEGVRASAELDVRPSHDANSWTSAERQIGFENSVPPYIHSISFLSDDYGEVQLDWVWGVCKSAH